MIVAGDEASLYLQATLARVWHPTGESPVVKISPKRDSTHFFGALNLHTGKETVLRATTLNAFTTICFLLMLLKAYPTQPILLLWDRAPWHRNRLVQAFLQAHTRLQILWFPTASPDLNPQEHVWKATREAISHNHSIPKLDDLALAFETHLTVSTFSCSLLELHDYNDLCVMFK